MRRRQPEAHLQRAVFAHLRAHGAKNMFAFHPANGGFRKAAEAAILKGMGVTPGVPDIIIVYNGRTYALELKVPDGKLTDTQERAIAAMRQAGATTAVAYGLDEALSILQSWGLLRGKIAA